MEGLDKNRLDAATMESPANVHHDDWIKGLAAHNPGSANLHYHHHYHEAALSFNRNVGEVLYASGLTDMTPRSDGIQSRLDVAIFRVSEERGRLSTNVSFLFPFFFFLFSFFVLMPEYLPQWLNPYKSTQDPSSLLGDFSILGKYNVAKAGSGSGATYGTKLDTLVVVRMYQGGGGGHRLLTETCEKCAFPAFPSLPFAGRGDSGALVFNHLGEGEGIVWGGGGGGQGGPSGDNEAAVTVHFDPPAPEIDPSGMVFYTKLDHVRDYVREKMDAEHGRGGYKVYWGRGGPQWI